MSLSPSRRQCFQINLSHVSKVFFFYYRTVNIERNIWSNKLSSSFSLKRDYQKMNWLNIKKTKGEERSSNLLEQPQTSQQERYGYGVEQILFNPDICTLSMSRQSNRANVLLNAIYALVARDNQSGARFHTILSRRCRALEINRPYIKLMHRIALIVVRSSEHRS